MEVFKIVFKIVLKIIKIIICIAIILLFPFAFALITRFLIHVHLYANIEEFKNYINMFNNIYFIIILLIGTISVFLISCNKENLKKLIRKLKFTLKYKDTQIDASFNDVIEEADVKKNFIELFGKNNKDESKDEDKEIKTKVQAELKMIKKPKKNTNEIEFLKQENNNLRFYATYNIINKKTKELLNIIYCDKSMRLKDFKKRIEYSYIDRNKNNKNINKKDLKNYASNKSETILKGLLYLEIIEITDDEIESIALTQFGEEFVEKYIEKEVGDYEN